jgi:hypothetical protein
MAKSLQEVSTVAYCSVAVSMHIIMITFFNRRIDFAGVPDHLVQSVRSWNHVANCSAQCRGDRNASNVPVHVYLHSPVL